MPRIISTLDEFENIVGEHLGYSDYLAVTQEKINLFADATGDHQWIHVAEGRVTLNGKTLEAGDAGIVDEAVPLIIAASKTSQVLLFDLN